MYRVYTGAKTPAQGHRRLVGRWRQAAAVAHRWCYGGVTQGRLDHDGRFRNPRTPSPNWRMVVRKQAGQDPLRPLLMLARTPQALVHSLGHLLATMKMTMCNMEKDSPHT